MKQAYLLVSLILLNPPSGYTQHRKVPVSGSEDSYTNQVIDPQDSKPPGFKQVTFTNYYGHYDTSQVFIASYSKDGRLKETELYEYKDEKEMDEPPFDQIQTHISAGNRETYIYDEAGNLKTLLKYDIMPANSFPAIWFNLIAAASREMNKEPDDEGKNESEEKIEERRARYMKMAVDLIKKGTPELPTLKEEINYDADGNPVFNSEPVDKNSTRYTYTYDDRGRVKLQRQLYISTENNKANGSDVFDYRYTYTPNDKVASLTIYYMGRDTAHLLPEGYETRIQTYHYNARELVDTITFFKDGEIYTHVITYTDTLRTAYTILKRYSTSVSPKNDSVSYTTYKYNKDGMQVEYNGIYFYNEKRSSAIRFQTFYNADKLPIETRKYSSEFGNPESLSQQTLFFYNKPYDKETLARSLYNPRPQREVREMPKATKPVKHTTKPPAQTQSSGNMVEAPPPAQDLAFVYVEQPPQFKGDIVSFISTNLKYPNEAYKARVEGKVFIKFIVRRDGKITDAQVVKGIGSGCDEEALRLVSIMPDWTPGKQNGVAVSVYFTMPITFERRK